MTNKKGDKEEDKRRQGQRKRADTRSDGCGKRNMPDTTSDWCPPFSAGDAAFLFICLPGLQRHTWETDEMRHGQGKREDTTSDRLGRHMNRNVTWLTVKGGHHS